MSTDLLHQWALNDHQTIRQFSFTEDQRADLLIELKHWRYGGSAQALIPTLEREITGFLAWKAFEQQQASTAPTDASLWSFWKSCEALKATIIKMDWATRRALAPHLIGRLEPSDSFFSFQQAPAMSDLETRLSIALLALESVQNGIRHYANQPPEKRRRTKKHFAPEQFAFELARQLDRIVDPAVPVLSTHEGSFEIILRMCLEAAQDGTCGDIRRYVIAGVKRLKDWKKQQDRV